MKSALNIEKLNMLLGKFNLKTTNYKEYFLAFTHSTYANEHHLESNERIEFLGDGLLNLLTGEYIYKTFPEMTEGEMTKLRAIYVCEEANYNYAISLGLDELLLLGVGEEQTGGRKKKAVVADTFECFLGATYLTFGLEAVRNILSTIFFPNIKRLEKELFVDYKTKLQELIQADHDSKLEYIVIKEEGRPNEKWFTMQVRLEGMNLGVGCGKSKKEASQEAAKDALRKMAK